MLRITPGSIESDGHVVLMPAGLTGEVVLDDGTRYDLGPAAQIAIEVSSHDHAKKVALEVSRRANDDESIPVEHDDAQSRKNLGIKKGS